MKLFWICLFFVGVAAVSAQNDDEYYDNDYQFYDSENEGKVDYQIEDNRSEAQDEKENKIKDEQASKEEEIPENEENVEQPGDTNDSIEKENDDDDENLPKSKEVYDKNVPFPEAFEPEDPDGDLDFDDWLRKLVDGEDEEIDSSQVINEEKKDNSEEVNKDEAESIPGLDFVDENEEKNSEENQNNNEEIEFNSQSKETIDESFEDNVNGDEVKENKDLVEETLAILNENEGNDFEDDKIDIEIPVADEIVEETKQILEETDNSFDESDNNEEIHQNIDEDTNGEIDEQLRVALKELQEKFNELNEDYVEPEKNADDSIFAYGNKKADSSEKSNDFNTELKSDESNNDDVNGSQNYETSFENGDEGTDGINITSDEKDTVFDSNEYDDDTDFSAEPAEKASFEENEDASLFGKIEKAVTEKTEQSKSEEIEETKLEEAKETDTKTTTVQQKTINVTDLTPEQYDQVMQQFKVLHSEEIEQLNVLDSSIAPVHITLSVDEPTVVTSPNYPLAYPTNNVVEWVFTGDGVGIELNITDFFVNGVMGHYLLVVPGGIDASNTDGLIFSYQLTEPRRYRFFDVNQMFMRFEASLGMQFARGFSLSAKMIMEQPGTVEEALPEPEAVLPEPTQTLTLHLGGLTLQEFRSAQEAFRLIIADMATMYINANGIDPGLNDTLATTQITRTAPCNVQWPQYEHCSQVTFGVPLVYELKIDEVVEQRLSEDDLRAMWDLYSGQDPFVSMLRGIGVMEFSIPNDNSILAAWVVIGVGVVISMALLAFALWRFSCLENYSRMPQYSDRDSLYSEKQGVDLYPTPHQTLPPLFADVADYKWDEVKYDDSTRVDMGGFANKSYARDVYDIDSDEDIITTKDRMPGFTNEKFSV